MPSVVAPEVFLAISAATANSVTVSDATQVYPGTYGWISKDDGSAQTRVKIIDVSATGNIVTCRIVPNNADEFGNGYPNFTYSSNGTLAGYATGSHLSINTQTAPINPAFSKRSYLGGT